MYNAPCVDKFQIVDLKSIAIVNHGTEKVLGADTDREWFLSL